jgi:undecaprenyl-diphosphatase
MKPMARVSVRRVVHGRKPRYLLSGAALSLLGYTALAVLAAQQVLVDVDVTMREWVALLRSDLLRRPMEVITGLGDAVGLIPLIAVGMALLWRVSRRWAIALPFLMAGAGVLQYVTKRAAGLPRPDEAPWGFPSGHVLSLVVFLGVGVWLVLTATPRRRRWRLAAAAVGTAAVGAVAFSRLYLDKHWLSDLAGGFMAGMTYLLLAIWVVEVVIVDRRGPTPPPPGTSG